MVWLWYGNDHGRLSYRDILESSPLFKRRLFFLFYALQTFDCSLFHMISMSVVYIVSDSFATPKSKTVHRNSCTAIIANQSIINYLVPMPRLSSIKLYRPSIILNLHKTEAKSMWLKVYNVFEICAWELGQ